MLDKYNTLVTSMLPPKLVLMWEQVTQLDFLTYIETLRGQDDVCTKDWTKQPFHNAMRVWTKLLHACEELTIIGTEAHQLMASMKSEEDLGEADRNLAIDKLVDVLVDLDVE